jgi:FAD:protein FMN transferase
MYEFAFSEHLMGTELSIALITEDEVRASEIYNLSLSRLRAYESQFSRFDAKSELSRLNQERSCIVSPFFMTVLHIARRLYIETDGHFNPLLQIERFGYTKTYDAIKEHVQKQNTLPYNTNLNMVIIDEQTSRVTLIDDQKLDFGGFLKGYLAEIEAKHIMEIHKEVHGVIVNIGGDLHTQGRDAHGNIFVFEIENPVTGHGIDIPLENISLATSGTYRHSWNTDTERMHHILAKGGTHNPETNIVSSSVIHESGASAEAYAKTLMTLAPLTLESMLDTELQYVLIYSDGTTYTSL